MTAVPAVRAAPAAVGGGVAPVRLESFRARDWRNLAPVEVPVAPAGVALVGDNGHGKTNLLEAVAYLGLLRAVRGARDRDCVRFGAEHFHLGASVAGTAVRSIAVGCERTTQRKRVHLDGVVAPRLADAFGAVPSVLVAPADVALVAGGPQERRRYVDVLLALASRPYLAALRDYRAALERRNAAARAAQSGRGAPAAMAAWEPLLVRHGAALVEARRAWVAEVRARFAALCAAIGERATAGIAYAGGVADAEDPAGALADALARDRARDIARGATGTGPHRDDLVLTLDGRDLRTFGSAGQQRTAAIALRLLEAETLRAQARTAPLLLLDDPFAELDRRRAAAVLDLVTHADVGQTWLAVPRAEEIPAAYAALARWRVSDGTVTPA